MARYNEILAGRYNRMLQKLFQMKGQAPAPQLAGDISVNMQLFNGCENRYLEQWDLFAFGTSVAAVAAINSTLRIRNPAGSNRIAVITKAMISAATADTGLINGQATNADLVVSAQNSTRLDARLGVANISSMIISNSDATHPGGLARKFQTNFPTGGGVDFILHQDQEIPLLPGDAYELQDGTVNIAINVMFMWRERFLEEGERT